jgi:hypothetical protein
MHFVPFQDLSLAAQTSLLNKLTRDQVRRLAYKLGKKLTTKRDCITYILQHQTKLVIDYDITIFSISTPSNLSPRQ